MSGCACPTHVSNHRTQQAHTCLVLRTCLYASMHMCMRTCVCVCMGVYVCVCVLYRGGDLDGKVRSFDEHEDSVYGLAWSCADPWLFASLSYDGRMVVNK